MFALIGVIGAVLLVLSLMFDDVLDSIIPDNGWISGPVIASFLAAFGLFGWVSERGFDANAAVASVIGIGGGIGLGVFTYRITKSLIRMPTDGTPTPQDLVGRQGRVVTAIGPGSVGEVLVQLGGQPVKVTAVADTALERGASIVVIQVETPTKVVVQAKEAFWGEGTPAAGT